MRQHIREVGPITVVTTLILTGNASFEVWAHFIEWDGERHFGVIWTDVFRLCFVVGYGFVATVFSKLTGCPRLLL